MTRRTFNEARQEDLRDILRHIKHAVSLGHTRLACGIPLCENWIVSRLRAMGFGVEMNHENGVMYVDWSEPERKETP